jgi:hypothetical protein
MAFFRTVLAGLCLFLGTSVWARTVRSTLWISGGLEGILHAGANAPGLLGVLQYRANAADPGFWIDHGGSRDFALLRGLSPELLPDAVIPGEDAFRLPGGLGPEADLSRWTLFNLGILPQFPGGKNPFAESRSLRSADGLPVRVVGLLAEDAPWFIPPQRLQPLRVLEPRARLAQALPVWRAGGPEVRVLALPERADAAEWSLSQPDFDILVLPAAAPAEVVPIDGGRRWRVRPAPHGRALIRVLVSWDTVSRSVTTLEAAVEWIPKPDLEGREWPPALRDRLRPLYPAPEAGRWPNESAARAFLADSLLRKLEAHAVLVPELRRNDVDVPTLADSWKVAWLPRDQAWVKLTADAPVARAWTEKAWLGHHWHVRELPRVGPVTVLLPAELAARSFRNELDQPAAEILPWTIRDFLPQPESRK